MYCVWCLFCILLYTHLFLFCVSIKLCVSIKFLCASVRRMYFYKTATLVREGMVVIHSSGLNGDPTSAKVCRLSGPLGCVVKCWCVCVLWMCVHDSLPQIEIDRRMLDFCVGLDTEFSETVEGSHLYYPQTKFSQACHADEATILHAKTS